MGPALRTALCERVLEPELPLEEGLRVSKIPVTSSVLCLLFVVFIYHVLYEYYIYCVLSLAILRC